MVVESGCIIRLFAPQAAGAHTRQGVRPDIAAKTHIVVLELTEEEATALDSLLSHWPSRRLALRTGHSRNTLRAWFCRAQWQLRRGIELPRSDSERAKDSFQVR